MSEPRKKLIEVALPLSEINDASAYDKMPGIGPHPKGIHQWWARLPLPTARAILFASIVDDPSEHPDRFPTEEAQNAERERLFNIIRSMMVKKLHEQPKVYAAAHTEMLKHCDGNLPAVYDPFAGGGSIPLEANRLGFESHAADLNPVAVMLNKCNLELVPHWTGSPTVNPEDRKRIGGSESWRGTHGLAADLRYYGSLVRDRARQRIGHLYPKAACQRTTGLEGPTSSLGFGRGPWPVPTLLHRANTSRSSAPTGFLARKGISPGWSQSLIVPKELGALKSAPERPKTEPRFRQEPKRVVVLSSGAFSPASRLVTTISRKNRKPEGSNIP